MAIIAIMVIIVAIIAKGLRCRIRIDPPEERTVQTQLQTGAWETENGCATRKG